MVRKTGGTRTVTVMLVLSFLSSMVRMGAISRRRQVAESYRAARRIRRGGRLGQIRDSWRLSSPCLEHREWPPTMTPFFHHSEFTAAALAERKGDQIVSVCLPA